MPTKADKHPVALEEMSAEQIEELKTKTLEQIAALRATWSGLHELSEKERREHPGRVALVMEKPFRMLFDLLSPAGDAATSDDERHKRQQLRGIFDSTLGSQDDGDDDERFEADVLLRHLARMNAAYEVSEQLDQLSRRFSDDALHTAGQVVSPGLKALDLARSVARGNPALRGLLAGMLDSLRQMTKAARTKRAPSEEPKLEQQSREGVGLQARRRAGDCVGRLSSEAAGPSQIPRGRSRSRSRSRTGDTRASPGRRRSRPPPASLPSTNATLRSTPELDSCTSAVTANESPGRRQARWRLRCGA